MPNRTFNSESYRYGFNGMEKDDEWKAGAVYDYGFRIYDARIAKFLSVDPLTSSYPWYTPYQFAGNSPIKFIDLDGLEKKVEGTAETETKTDPQLDNSNSKDMAIMVAFPDQKAKIPTNQGAARWLEETFGDGSGDVTVGHAGIVIINKESGTTKYFDFGRYDVPGNGSRGTDEGAVRSSKTFPRLIIPNWNDELTDDENVAAILNALDKGGVFKGYGRITGALYKELDYSSMLAKAEQIEQMGNVDFGGYETTDDCPTYCAKFARTVANAGGADFSIGTFTGEANIQEAANDSDTEVLDSQSGFRTIEPGETIYNYNQGGLTPSDATQYSIPTTVVKENLPKQ